MLRPENDFVMANALRTPTFKTCKFGERCTHFSAFSRYRFSEEGLQHMQAFDHPHILCRYARECRAHARLCEGGWRFDDQCHCAMFSHGRPARAHWEGASVMAGEDLAWSDASTARSAGGLLMVRPDLRKETQTLKEHGVDLVRAELEAHGLLHEMWMLENVVPSKRQHPRLLEAQASVPRVYTFSSLSDPSGNGFNISNYQALKKQPVLDVEIFAGLLYTGTDAQGQIRKALREPASNVHVANGWIWTITALRHLVYKLAEDPPERLYHGLNDVRPPSKDTLYSSRWASYYSIVSGSMSLEIGKIFGKGKGGTVDDPSAFGTVFHFDLTKSNDYDWPAVVCADMRWMSKFADEREWLMIPCHSSGGVGMGKCRSEPLPSGGELLHQECWWTCW